MPLILDNLVVILWRILWRWSLEFRCRNWHWIGGVISSVKVDGGMYPFVEIRYGYTILDARHKGSYRHEFWYPTSAKDFAGGFRGGDSIRLRYSPRDPSKSYVLMDDQVSFLTNLSGG
jgi:hypothetical protein